MRDRTCSIFLILLLLSFVATLAQEPLKEPSNPARLRENQHDVQGVVASNRDDDLTNVVYITVIIVSCVIAIMGLVTAGVCWYKHKRLVLASERVVYRSSDSSVLIHNGFGHLHDDYGSNIETNRVKQLSGLAQRTDYPAYGITGPNPLHNQSYEPPIDVNLNRSAEMFHYNQTKKRMKGLSSATSESSNSSRILDPHDVAAELEINDEETSEGEYTVYECSGFALVGDGPMEVHNPLFDET